MQINCMGEGAKMKNCPVCKNDFINNGRKINALCCSKECSLKRNKTKNPLLNQFAKFEGSTGTKGAISELKASADLLLKGYQVFRAVSPSAHCDLVILDKDGILKRVEVRSGVKNREGKLFFTRTGKYDVIACVFRNKVQYEGLR